MDSHGWLWKSSYFLFNLIVAMVELGVEFLIKVFKVLIKKLTRVIALLNTFGDVIVNDFELFDMLADFVWILAFISENLHGAALLVKVHLQFRELEGSVLTEGVKEKTVVRVELLAASPGERGLFLSLHALSLHVVEQQVLLLIGPASLLVRPEDRLNRAVVDAKLLGDGALAEIVHLVIVYHIEPVTVTDVLVNSVCLQILDRLRIILDLIWDHNLSQLDISMRIEGIFSPHRHSFSWWFNITDFEIVSFVDRLNCTLSIHLTRVPRFSKR